MSEMYEIEEIKIRRELLDILNRSETDVKNGKVSPISETFDTLRKYYPKNKNFFNKYKF